MRRVVILLWLIGLLNSQSWLEAREGIYQFIRKGNTVICKNVRFQVLSSSLIRMEFSPRSKFTDASTVVVLKRDWPPAAFEAREEKNGLIIETEALCLRYLLDSGEFSAENLRIFWEDEQGRHRWSPGEEDDLNLGGICCSLDRVGKYNLPEFPPGLLSESGYFLLDDSDTPIWEEKTAWIAPRQEKDNQDWYFFVYGRNYAQMLKEFSELTGKIPLIPRYTLGAWITDLNFEYTNQDYSAADIKKIINRFRDEKIPLDILVLDFGWHLFGWKGGYDWSPIFPEPQKFLSWAHEQGIKISLNDHPGYGGESILCDADSHSKTVREKLGMSIPREPEISMDLHEDWQFQTDPANRGIAEEWFGRDFDDADWKTVEATSPWEEQGFPNYDGYGWYRKWVSFSEEDWQGKPVLLIFGGVDDEYDLFINGKKVIHHGAHPNSVWDQTTCTDISSRVELDKENLICLRVNDWGGGGGICGQASLISDQKPSQGIHFNLADKLDAEVFMEVLHNPLMAQGVDFWWVDGGSGSCQMEGLNSQLWTNRVYYDGTEKYTRKRSFIFSRWGGWGSHRYPAFFTGDTHSQWEVLRYEIPFTANGGNVLMPYITHDIGGFSGKIINFDLYLRWIQFGVFGPFLRLHSVHENPSVNARLPWNYGERDVELCRKFFGLRYSLIPYIYTYCRIAHDIGLPLVRPLWLAYPKLESAYLYPDEYLFGKELLVAPITEPADNGIVEKEIYLPPGKWVDYFTGLVYAGERTIIYECPLERIPVFVREGSILPLQPEMRWVDEKPVDPLIVNIYPHSKDFGVGVYPAASGIFSLYEDDGASLDYRQGKYAWTPLSFNQAAEGNRCELKIGPTKGTFDGQLEKRGYRVKVHNLSKPKSVELNARRFIQKKKQGPGWFWEKEKNLLIIDLGRTSIREEIKLTIQ